MALEGGPESRRKNEFARYEKDVVKAKKAVLSEGQDGRKNFCKTDTTIIKRMKVREQGGGGNRKGSSCKTFHKTKNLPRKGCRGVESGPSVTERKKKALSASEKLVLILELRSEPKVAKVKVRTTEGS